MSGHPVGSAERIPVGPPKRFSGDRRMRGLMGSLSDLQQALEDESDEMFGDRWRKGSRLYWATALAGEVGELCNLVKREARDGTDLTPQVGEEIADIVISSFLTASAVGLSIEEVVARKRELIRAREGSTPT